MSRVPSLAEARRRARGHPRRAGGYRGGRPRRRSGRCGRRSGPGRFPAPTSAAAGWWPSERCPGTSGAAAGDEDSPLPVTASEVRAPELAALLAEHACTYRLRSRKTADGSTETYEEEVTPQASALAAALASKEWPQLRPLFGIVGAPVLRPDGSLLQQPGYHDPGTCPVPGQQGAAQPRCRRTPTAARCRRPATSC